MQTTTRRFPSIVVIQERHVRHGENFKIFKVSCRSRREYIAKFMSSRRTTYRCKSRKVRIGRMLKETTYKGSPLAISRLLLLDGLDAAFPTFDQLRMDAYRPSTSYFNLSDRSRTGVPSRAKFGYSVKDLIGPPQTSASDLIDMMPEKNCTPGSIPDFDLIFGSDTTEGEDLWSDDEAERQNVSVAVSQDPGPISSRKTEESNITSTLARMENEIKKLLNSFEVSKNLPKAASIPLPFKKIHQHPGCHQDNVKLHYPPNQTAQKITSSYLSEQSSSPGSSHFLCPRNKQKNANQLPSRNTSSIKGLKDIVEPSGCIPFFRIPGGCFLVVHATNQTTPLLHTTFVTGSPNTMQYQQTNLPVYGSHQVVAVHLGPYRLSREEVQGVFTFACGTKGYDSNNTGRSK